MNGILLIDKPAGLTSHDVVYQLRKRLGTTKIGHTGTLDPMATGLLVICVGRATKLVKYLFTDTKKYQATIRFGVATDTDDITGNQIDTLDVDSIDVEELKRVLESFLGDSMQIPPVASAIKINGKRAYEYVHKNLARPQMEPRPISIFSLILEDSMTKTNQFVEVSVSVSCSKGTYIRSLARDIGAKMHLPATLSNLRRIQVGNFVIEDAKRIDEVSTEMIEFINPLKHLDFPVVYVIDEYLPKIKNGAFLPTDIFESQEDSLVCDKEGNPLAIYTFDVEKNIMRLSVLL